MHEGLDQDDGYMLVEDEFYDIATGFTAHLHHAEYKRLMREAQERRIAQKTAFGLVVPEDATVEMKQRMKRDALGEKQSAGLKAMLGNGIARGDGDSDEEEGDGEEDAVERQEKKIGDPWAGTTLAGLMRFEPGDARTSLRGLEGVRSRTRAALGFGPTTTTATTITSSNSGIAAEQPRKRETQDHVRPTRNNQLPTDRKTSAATTVRPPSIEVKKEPDSDPTRLPKHHASTSRKLHTDTPVVKTELQIPTLQNQQQRIKQEPTDQSQIPAPQPHVHVSAAPRRKYHKFIDDLDDFDDDLFELHNNGTQAQPRQAQGQSTSPSKVKSLPRPRLIKKEEKDDNGKYDGRLDEVPIFLT